MLLSAEADKFRSDPDSGIRLQRLEIACVVAVFAACALVRLWGMSRVHSWDENVYLQNAELICCGKHNYNEIDSRPPLLSLIFAGAFFLWHSDYFAWIITALLNALGPVLLYLSGRIFVGRRPASIAALLLGFTPFFVSVFPSESTGFLSDDTGHSLLSDCPALTLILLAFWLLLRALQKERGVTFFLAGLAAAMAILMRFASLSSIGILSLLLLTARSRPRAIAAYAAGLLMGIAPYLAWSRIRYGGFLRTFILGWQNFGGNQESRFYYLKYSPFTFTWVALAGWMLWIVSRTWKARQQRSVVLPAINPPGDLLKINSSEYLVNLPVFRECFLFAWASVLLIIFSLMPHQEPRYVMPAAPPIFLLAGVGWSAALKAPHRMLRMACAVVLAGALLISFWPIRHRFDTPFFDNDVSEQMMVSDFLNHHVAAESILYTNSNYPDFGYYTNFPVTALPMNGAELYTALEHLRPNSILIAYKKYDSGPTPEPSLAWLDANPRFRRLQNFPNTVVYRYVWQEPQRKQ
jgi:Dolichyl-phosphate-mannose-protein mannosyltransferase